MPLEISMEAVAFVTALLILAFGGGSVIWVCWRRYVKAELRRQEEAKSRLLRGE